MSDWQPKKGDRVMINDATWAWMNNGSRRVGRRGGVVVGISTAYGEPTARVLWDGLKLPVHLSCGDLMLDDPNKHEPPAKDARDRAKAAYRQTEIGKVRRRLREMISGAALTEELARKLNRALDAMERGDFDDPE